jgi:hypothetical protein
MESLTKNHLDSSAAVKRRNRLIRYAKLAGNQFQPKVVEEQAFATALQISQYSRAEYLAEARSFLCKDPRHRMESRPFVSLFVRRHRGLLHKLARVPSLVGLNATWLGMLALVSLLSS